VTVNSDNGGTAKGGNITVQSVAVIDVSGGAGTIAGGSARTGSPGAAVTLDADNSGNSTVNNGIIVNSGSIVARGGTGTAQGIGGNVLFDGQDLSATIPFPLASAGSLDLSGSVAGTFTGN